MSKIKLSVVLATRNEELNIEACLNSIVQIADEIIVVDEESTDRTREIAKSIGARVFKVKHSPIFHKTKQIAVEKASGEWILQLDADERVSASLGREILKVINLTSEDLLHRTIDDKRKLRLFKKHQRVIEERDGKLGEDSLEIVAFFVPRINYFLGKPLIHAGVYPDGVIRLFKRGYASFPAKSVHEQPVINGKIAWLVNDLEHHDSPTLRRYFVRANRYTSLTASTFKQKDVAKNIFNFVYFTIIKPSIVFVKLFIRHKGFLDGMRGFLWSFFSAVHFPIAYYKYWVNDY